MKAPIGFVGLGLMGTPMAKRLLTAGYSLAVYNRSREKSSLLVEYGATLCESPSEVAKKSEVVFSMVSNSEALEEISLGKNGIMQGLRNGGVHVDMSTVSPALTQRLSSRYNEEGRSFIHSPVLGSVPQATDGSLLLFVGGDDAAIQKADPMLRILGNPIWRLGKPAQASHTKLLCNMFIAGMGTTLAQALVFGQKADVDPHVLLDILAHSSLNAPMYQTKGKSILERNFAPRFFVEHMLKDIRLMMEAGKSLNVALPGVEVAERLFADAAKEGFGREDYSAVIKVLEMQADVTVGSKHASA